MTCPHCHEYIKEPGLFCPHCEKELFPVNPSMEIALGREESTNKQEILKELILNLNHLSKRAEKETDREQLVFLFQSDLLGYASDGYDNEVYFYPAFSEALIRTAKVICNKL